MNRGLLFPTAQLSSVPLLAGGVAGSIIPGEEPLPPVLPGKPMPRPLTDKEDDPPIPASSVASIACGCGPELAVPPSFVDTVPRGMVVSSVDLLCSVHSPASSPAA